MNYASVLDDAKFWTFFKILIFWRKVFRFSKNIFFKKSQKCQPRFFKGKCKESRSFFYVKQLWEAQLQNPSHIYNYTRILKSQLLAILTFEAVLNTREWFLKAILNTQEAILNTFSIFRHDRMVFRLRECDFWTFQTNCD